MAPQDVVLVAQKSLDVMDVTGAGHQIVSVRAVLAKDLPAIEPAAGAPVESRIGARISWVVRANGPFVGRHGRRAEPYSAMSGFLEIDDETGLVVGMGLP